jgi:hypothetical protein
MQSESNKKEKKKKVITETAEDIDVRKYLPPKTPGQENTTIINLEDQNTIKMLALRAYNEKQVERQCAIDAKLEEEERKKCSVWNSNKGKKENDGWLLIRKFRSYSISSLCLNLINSALNAWNVIAGCMLSGSVAIDNVQLPKGLTWSR